MAEVLVSAVVTVLVDKLYSRALMSFARSQGIDSQLNEWKKTLPMIQAVLADAAHKQITQKPVELWLIELQDLAYDIEDVLDDIATEVMKQDIKRSQASSSTSSSKLPKILSNFTPHNIMYRRRMSSKIDKITSKMHNLFKLKNDLGLVENREFDRPYTTTTSYVNESTVLGREKDKEALIRQLLGNENGISIVSIVGMGGLGKTTLAQLLYNDQRVKNQFELRAWVCVSDSFDVFDISKQIYQAVVGADKTFNSLNLLHEALQKELSNKRFLVVLDDVWNEDHNKWDGLRSAFDVGADGSKFLVTTRNKEVASVMDCFQHYELKVLSDEISLSLLAQSALGEQNFDDHPSIQLTAQSIVKKCDGLPLALKALGRLLKTKRNEAGEWEKLLHSEIWDLKDEDGILPALKLSYYGLPSHLKRVFAYCSLFPKDYVFEKKKLVLLWMAQGFLSQPNGINQTMESLGRKYFEDLLSRSFFQPLGYSESQYTMHDLMNDLATSVAGEFFFRLDDIVDSNGRDEAYEKFRHFSFISQEGVAEYKKFKELHRARCLRTFLPVSVSVGWGNFDTLNSVIARLLPHLHFLRVLSLTGYSITEVPQSVGSLKHLRYLNFSKTSIQQIPEEVSELYNLQSLLLCDCKLLRSLPVSFAKLINLRHLDLTDTWPLMKMPFGIIGGLTSLQTLSKVIIEGGDGFKVSELKGLKDLKGELSIKGLEKVIDPIEATAANLQEKKGLDDLELVWGGNTSNEDDVIEKLRPHSKLKTLQIKGYGGKKFPSWLGNPTSFDQLTELVLKECNNCTEIPTLEQLASLQKLEISCCSKLVSINKGEKEAVNVGSNIMGSLRQVKIDNCDALESYCCPNSVESLEIVACSKLVSIKGEKEVVNVGSSIMGSLTHVTLFGCEKLESYCCPNSVESLQIWHCSSMTSLSFSKLQQEKEDNLPSSSSSSSSSNLKILTIYECKNMKSISQEHLQSLTSLEVMCILHCPGMEDSFPSPCGSFWPPNLRILGIGELKKPMSEWGFQNYPPSLVLLSLYGKNSGVVSFEVMEEQQDNKNNINTRSSSTSCFLLPPSLTELRIHNFEQVESVSEVLQHLPHLQQLEIKNCPKLRDVPESTSSLTVYVKTE